jgi:hypothetical protein
MKRFLTGVALVLVWSATAAAQQAVVSRNVNLRPTPSNAQPEIKLLLPPEALTLLEPNPTGGYYHVQSSAGPGWVWGRNIKFPPPGAASPTTFGAPPAPPPPAAPAYAITHPACPPVGKYINKATGQLMLYSATSDGGLRDMAKRHLPTGTTPKTLTFADFVALQQDVDTLTGKDAVHHTVAFTPDRTKLRNLQTASGAVSEGDLVQVAGYVRDARQGSVAEAVNCAGTDGRDVHINAGPTKTSSPYAGIVTEMIPQLPQTAWTYPNATRLIDGQTQVLVVGGLTYDNEHQVNKDAANPVGGSPQRMSLWEIHPITAFYVCQVATCDPSQHTQWMTFTAWVAAHPH